MSDTCGKRAVFQQLEKISECIASLLTFTFSDSYMTNPEFLESINLGIGISGVAVLRNTLYVAMHNLSTIFKYSAGMCHGMH